MFPNKLKINLINATNSFIRISDIILSVKLYATHHEDYYFMAFTDQNGQATITRKYAEASMREDRRIFGMDYKCPIEKCKDMVNVEILNEDAIKGYIEATKSWGVLDYDKERWTSKEDKIRAIQANNNRMVESRKEDFDLTKITADKDGTKQINLKTRILNTQQA